MVWALILETSSVFQHHIVIFEQLERMPKLGKVYKKKLTDEQRRWKSERDRNWRAGLSDEQRKLNAQRCREWRCALSGEQRQQLAEQRRASITSEKRSKDAQRKRRLHANITQEQREKKSERERQRRANLTEEQRIELSERNAARKREAKNKNCYNLLNENHFTLNFTKIIPGIYNTTQSPLRHLINDLPDGNMNDDVFDALNKNILKDILVLFAFDYPKNILDRVKYSKKVCDFQIDLYYLIEVLKKWNGWILYANIKSLFTDQAYNDLFMYLQDNFNTFRPVKYLCILEELNKTFCKKQEFVINTSCSLRQLQMLFYYKPQAHIKFYHEESSIAVSVYQSSIQRYMFNWPFISIRIDLPDFSMIHRNDHINDFNILNLKKTRRKVFNKPRARDLYLDRSIKSDVFLQNFIVKFLKQLKFIIRNADNDVITLERQTELNDALSEFEKDISLCSDTVETNTKYHIELSPYPYVRYLGYPDSGDLAISTLDQKSIENSIINVRLKQTCYPKMSFVLEKFNVLYKGDDNNINFIFDDAYVYKINTCIHYTCLLCNEYLGSHSSSRSISDHLLYCHGLEADWECSNCSGSFTTNNLSKHRWYHDCSKYRY